MSLHQKMNHGIGEKNQTYFKKYLNKHYLDIWQGLQFYKISKKSRWDFSIESPDFSIRRQPTRNSATKWFSPYFSICHRNIGDISCETKKKLPDCGVRGWEVEEGCVVAGRVWVHLQVAGEGWKRRRRRDGESWPIWRGKKQARGEDRRGRWEGGWKNWHFFNFLFFLYFWV